LVLNEMSLTNPLPALALGPTQFIGQVFHMNMGRRQVCLRERPQMQKPARAGSEPADPRNGHGWEAGLTPVGLAMGGTVGVTAKSLGFLQPRLQQLNVFAQTFSQFPLPVPQFSLTRRLALAQAA